MNKYWAKKCLISIFKVRSLLPGLLNTSIVLIIRIMMGMMRIGTMGGLRNLVDEALGEDHIYSNFFIFLGSFFFAEISFGF